MSRGTSTTLSSSAAARRAASELSEDDRWTVLLLEAGQRTRDSAATEQSIAGAAADNVAFQHIDWKYAVEPQTTPLRGASPPGYAGRSYPIPRGKGLGGSNELNFMLHVRGTPADYDRWEALAGDTRWGAASMASAEDRYEAGIGYESKAAAADAEAKSADAEAKTAGAKAKAADAKAKADDAKAVALEAAEVKKAKKAAAAAKAKKPPKTANPRSKGKINDPVALVEYAMDIMGPAADYLETRVFGRDGGQLERMHAATFFDPLSTIPPSEAGVDAVVTRFRFCSKAKAFVGIGEAMKLELFRYRALIASIPSVEKRLDPDCKDTFDIATWWQAAGPQLPAIGLCLRGVAAHSPNSAPPERVFSILNDTFDNDQQNAKTDYIRLSLMLQYNSRGRKRGY